MIDEAQQIEAEGERKLVTVLFADVMGSMDMAEQQDPEQWRGIMQGFFSILSDAVHRFEGTVDKFTGDGIMAVFGAPIAHEDHAQRACYAALRMLDDISDYAAELRRKHGLNFSARIGINSGEVIAGAIGDKGEGNYTAIGHTVGLAQRMEALAEPGKAYLAEAAAELAHGYLDLEDLGEFEIKGASRPVRVHELTGIGSARSRLDLSRERGFSQFVGREEGVADARGWARGGGGRQRRRDRHRRRTGLGKSRLCPEFLDRCRGLGFEVFEAQAQSHGQETPFAPVLQILRAYFGVSDSDPEQLSREKIAGRALLLEPGLVEDLPVLFDFMGLSDPDRPPPQLSPEARQRSLRTLLCKLLHAPNRAGPSVNVIEDLHWMDDGERLAARRAAGIGRGHEDAGDPQLPARVLAELGRAPELQPDPARAARHRRHQRAAARPRRRRPVARRPRRPDPRADRGQPVLRRGDRPRAHRERLARGRARSPELVQPVCDIKVPSSVQTVLAARIDRLDADAKQLVQAMSVAGREVPQPALMRISPFDDEGACGEALQKAIDAEFLYEAELYPERVIAFRHPLTLEVAYGSQLAEQRARTHAAVARATMDLNPDRHDELATLIAHHFEEGGELREAARWSARGAYWAGHSQPREAQRLWQSVMRLVPDPEEDAGSELTRGQLAPDAARLRLAAGDRPRRGDEARHRGGGDRDQDGRQALAGDVEDRRRSPPREAPRPGRVACRSGRSDRPCRRIRRRSPAGGGARDRRLPPPPIGDFDGFEAVLDEMIGLIDGDRTIGAGVLVGSPLAYAYMSKGMALRERARFEEAEDYFIKALRIAEEDGDPETASWVKSNHALLLAVRGDVEEGLDLAHRGLESTERLGDIFSRTVATSNLAAVQLVAGDAESALESIETAERIYLEAMPDAGEMRVWREGIHSEALLGVGRAEDALAIADSAVETARRYRLLWSLPLALKAQAKARAAAGRGVSPRRSTRRSRSPGRPVA